jgi:hypothetical protein
MVTSYAHDWRGNHSLTCIRCGVKTLIGFWSVSPCVKHYEDEKSGYKDES